MIDELYDLAIDPIFPTEKKEKVYSKTYFFNY